MGFNRLLRCCIVAMFLLAGGIRLISILFFRPIPGLKALLRYAIEKFLPFVVCDSMIHVPASPRISSITSPLIPRYRAKRLDMEARSASEFIIPISNFGGLVWFNGANLPVRESTSKRSNIFRPPFPIE